MVSAKIKPSSILITRLAIFKSKVRLLSFRLLADFKKVEVLLVFQCIVKVLILSLCDEDNRVSEADHIAMHNIDYLMKQQKICLSRYP